MGYIELCDLDNIVGRAEVFKWFLGKHLAIGTGCIDGLEHTFFGLPDDVRNFCDPGDMYVVYFIGNYFNGVDDAGAYPDNLVMVSIAG